MGLHSPLSCAAVVLTATSADLHGEPNQDLFRVDKDGKWGFIDETGQIVIEPVYEGVAPFSEGLAAVRLDGKFGYINKAGVP